MPGLMARLRTGPLTRWRAYWIQLAKDYKDVFTDTVQEAKMHPLKTSAYIAGISGLVYAWNTSPDLVQFRQQLLTADSRLRLLASQQRSRPAERHVRQLAQLEADRQLSVTNLGPLSLLWQLEYSEGAALPAVHCSYLQTWYRRYSADRLLDVGALSRWWLLQRAMRNYDVNEEEFAAETSGQPQRTADE